MSTENPPYAGSPCENRAFTTIQGVYRGGKIELLEAAPDIPFARVVITSIPPTVIDLADLGIISEQAANVRARLGSIAEDWDDPAMEIYDTL